MTRRSLEAHLARLERLLRPDPPPIRVKIASFSLYTLPLPEGTMIPAGARVVRDFFYDVPEHPDPDACLGGYRRERVTFDPEDQGRRLPSTEDAIGMAELAQADPLGGSDEPFDSAAREEMLDSEAEQNLAPSDAPPAEGIAGRADPREEEEEDPLERFSKPEVPEEVLKFAAELFLKEPSQVTGADIVSIKSAWRLSHGGKLWDKKKTSGS